MANLAIQVVPTPLYNYVMTFLISLLVVANFSRLSLVSVDDHLPY